MVSFSWQLPSWVLIFWCIGSSTAHALSCSGQVGGEELRAAIAVDHPDWFANIPVRLRLLPADRIASPRQCNFYRAAQGMNGALCVSIGPAIGTTADALVNPAGSYGDNAVDRLVQLLPDSGVDSFDCAAVQTTLTAAEAPPFMPVEIDPLPGQVCVRDVMRASHTLEAKAKIVDASGAAMPSQALLNTGAGCFLLDALQAPGEYPVSRFEVPDFTGAARDLGNTAPLRVGERPEQRVWFVRGGATGAGLGTLKHPFTSVAQLREAQGTASGPAAGDVIFMYASALYRGPLPLLSRQVLLGQSEDLRAVLEELGVPFPPGLNDFTAPKPFRRARSRISLVGPAPGDPDYQLPPRAAPVVLARHNQLRGLNLSCRGCSALFANSLGTLTTRNLELYGAVPLALFNMHLDMEVNTVDSYVRSSEDDRGPQVWVANTTGRVRIDNQAGEVFGSELEGGRGVLLRKTENITLRDFEALRLQASQVQNLTIEDARFDLRTDIPVSASQPGLGLSEVTGNVVLRDVEVFTGPFSAFNSTLVDVANRSGEVRVVFDDVRITGRQRGPGLSEVASPRETLLRLSASGDAKANYLVSDSFIGSSLNNVVSCSARDRAEVNCRFEGVTIDSGRQFTSRRFIKPLLQFNSDGAAFFREQDFTLNFQVVGLPLSDGSVQPTRLLGGTQEALHLNLLKGIGTANGLIENLEVRSFLDGDTSYFRTHRPLVIDNGVNVRSRVLVRDSALYDAVDGPAITANTAGNLDLTLERLGTFGNFSGSVLGAAFDSSTRESAVFCLDMQDNDFVTWGPVDDVVVELGETGSGSGGIVVPGYDGSPFGAGGSGTAGVDLLAHWETLGNRFSSFNPDLMPQVSATTVRRLAGGQGEGIASECLMPPVYEPSAM